MFFRFLVDNQKNLLELDNTNKIFELVSKLRLEIKSQTFFVFTASNAKISSLTNTKH